MQPSDHARQAAEELWNLDCESTDEQFVEIISRHIAAATEETRHALLRACRALGVELPETLVPCVLAADCELKANTLAAQLAGSQAFKTWVHEWLDRNGVPADPAPEQTAATGCRISGRMEWLKSQLAAAKQENETWHERIYDAFTCPNCRGSKQEFPGFDPNEVAGAEPPLLVDCCFCKGMGQVCWAGILTRYDDLQRQLAAVTAERDRLTDLRDKALAMLDEESLRLDRQELSAGCAFVLAVGDVLRGEVEVDGEISAEWLESVGFVRHGLALWFTGTIEDIEVWPDENEWAYGGEDFPTPQSRSDVLALMRLLGCQKGEAT